MLRPIPFHPNINLGKAAAFACIAIDAFSTLATFRTETFNAYQYRIYELGFCSGLQFPHLSLFSSSKGEVDVCRFMSKHSSDHYLLFLSRSPVTPRHRCVIMHEAVDGSLRKISHYQQNKPQQNYLLDTLVDKLHLINCPGSALP